MSVQMQQRRGTAAAWTTANTLLSQGEIGLETDTDKAKIGDGVTLWNSLAYWINPGATSGINQLTGDVTAGPGSGSQVATIASNVIVNAQINSGAAIAYSKLAALTASRALVSDGSGVVSVSSVTSTELGYVSGVTSSIQTQLSGKEPTQTKGSISTSTTGVSIGSGSNSTVGPNVTVDIQTATSSQPGLLSAADFTTFNAKQPAGNYITALTGDATASGPGSAAITIANAAVTYAKIQNVNTNKLLGRSTAGAGVVEEITIGTGLTLSAGTLTNTAVALDLVSYAQFGGF